MEIYIENFRTHKKLTYIISNEKIIRLDGDSGVGKTTILEAIYWCLYGKLKNITEKPNKEDKTKKELEKTIVNITFDNPKLKICRQKNPKRLIVNDKYIDIIGQNIIDNEIGNIDMFLSSSYIKQKYRCAFLDHNNNRKLEIMNQLAFQGSDIKKYKTMINDYLKKQQHQHEVLLIKYTNEKDIFEANVKKREYKSNYTDEHILHIDNYINQHTDEYNKLYELHKLEEQKKGQLKLLQSELNNYKNELNLLISPIYDITLDEIKIKKNKLDNMINQNKLNNELQKIIIDKTLPYLNFNMNDYDINKKHEYIYYNEYLPIYNNIIELKKNNILNINVDIDMLTDYKKLEDKYHKYINLLEIYDTYNDLSDIEKLENIDSINIRDLIIYEKNNEIYNNLYRELSNLNYLEYNDGIITESIIYDNDNNWIKYNKYVELVNKLDTYKNINNIPNIWNREMNDNLKYNHLKYNTQYEISTQLYKLLEIIKNNRYDGELNPEILYNLEKQHYLFTEKTKIYNEFNLINIEDKTNYINKLYKEILYLENMKYIEEYKNLEKVPYEYREIIELIQNIKINKHSLLCPHCNNKVILENDKLVKIENNIDINLNLETLERYLNILKHKNELENILKDIDINIIINDYDIVKLKNNINKLKNMIEVENDIQFDIEIYKAIYNYRLLYSQYNPVDKPIYSIDEGNTFLEYHDLLLSIRENQIEKPKYTRLELQNIMKYQQLKLRLDELNDFKDPLKYNSKKIERIQSWKSYKKELDYNHIDKLNYKYIDLLNTYNLQLEYEKLNKFESYKNLPPYTSEYILRIIENNKNVDLYNMLKDKGANDIDLSNDIDKLKLEIDNDENIYNNVLMYNENKNNIESKINKIKLELDNIKVDDTIESNLSINLQAIEHYKNIKDECLYSLDMLKWEKKLIDMYNILNNNMYDISSIQELYQDSCKVETEHLQLTLKNINRNINKISRDIFNDSINIKLKPTKHIESTDIDKNEINLEINHKGLTYYKSNDMSGGEDDRISFSFIIALNLLSNSPILLLDECLNSLNDEYREKCILALRNYLPDKIIFIISHQDIEGWYDKIIKL